MQNYQNLIKKVLTQGNIRTDRTNTGTISLFGEQLEFDLAKGFPLDASRQVFMRGNLEELFWMLRGSTDNTELTDKNVNIWSAWAIRQEHLEYSAPDRMELLLEKLNAESDNVDTATDKFNAIMADGLVRDEIALESLFVKHNIPKLRPNPRNVKVGALGPVYGEQWVNWPDPANDAVTTLLIRERVSAAEDMLAGAEGNFYQEDLERHFFSVDLAKVDDNPDEEYKEMLHQVLDGWNIPRSFTKRSTINQIAKLVDDLKTRPNSRRHIISAWNVAQLPDESKSPQQNVMDGKMALAPCHTLFQYYVEDRSVQDMIPELPEDVQREFKWFKKEHHLHHLGQAMPDINHPIGKAYWEAMFNFEDREKMMAFFKKHGVKTQKLSCKLYQRSCDILVGGAFNIAAYAAQLMMVAQCVGMVPGRFIHTFGDVHIYKNQILPNAAGDSVFTQLAHEPRPMPTLWINPEVKNIFDFKYEDFKLEGYDPHPAIKYPVAV